MKNTVSVIGLGYIGLPTSVVIANKHIRVFGFDVNEQLVKQINENTLNSLEDGLNEMLNNVVLKGHFSAHSNLQKANYYMVVVPTPFEVGRKPDLSYVNSAIYSILPLLKEGDTILIESTCPVGTTEKVTKKIFSQRPELNQKIFIAYCPERVLPGNALFELVQNDRVIGGINEESTQKAISFYEKFVSGRLHPTNARTAEMCKLTENASRDSQIAFANELSMICEEANINIYKLIELANMHPRVNILQPGVGVGGHCIAVDPYFIINQFPSKAQMINKAREINDFKTQWCINQINSSIDEFIKDKGYKPRIGLLGLSFKPNIDDLRESPAVKVALEIYNSFNQNKICIVEPYINGHEIFPLTNLSEAISESDIIVFLVAHNEFKSLELQSNKRIIDFCGIKNSSVK